MGYQLLVAEQLDNVLRAFKHIDFLIAIEYWLIQQLSTELKDQLTGAKIEVIKFGNWGAYPALAILYENQLDPVDIGPLVETTIERLLQERSVIELITFFRESGIDWNEVAKKIMGEGE